ncbi:BRD4-interacting chromatin-remodeling complex-associated protein-like [Triticum urartu]|uniref:BRD4-interacting chromatin-remodeling complex-associated protein-like n=1 Tax=Triticum urartu TaxID=4572 RepID=UPI00204384AE|nr:BRD4-interacting chromatin-remodeling complex-associated protein-like [Triticum urartu]
MDFGNIRKNKGCHRAIAGLDRTGQGKESFPSSTKWKRRRIPLPLAPPLLVSFPVTTLPHSVTPHEPSRLRPSHACAALASRRQAPYTLHGGLLLPPRSGQIPPRAPTSSQPRAPAAFLSALRLPSSPASGRLIPRAPAAFLPALRSPPFLTSGRLPPRAPASSLPRLRSPSSPRSGRLPPRDLSTFTPRDTSAAPPAPNPSVCELGDWDALLAAVSLMAVSGGSEEGVRRDLVVLVSDYCQVLMAVRWMINYRNYWCVRDGPNVVNKKEFNSSLFERIEKRCLEGGE